MNYLILPSNVRYDKRLCPSEKIIFAEIMSLCCFKGYCFATNRYFAELYKVDGGSVSRWVKHLRELGYIREEFMRYSETNYTQQRRIYIENVSSYKDYLPEGLYNKLAKFTKEDKESRELSITAIDDYNWPMVF